MQHYSISVNDNDSYMCSSTNRVFDDIAGVDVCPSCHYRTNFEFVNPEFDLKRKTYDLSATYDGYYIVSLKLMETVKRVGLSGLEFVPISRQPDFYVMFLRNVVPFDTEKRNTRAEKYCESCGNFDSVVGATPAFLKEEPTAELSRTDISFGSGNSKHPLLIASENFVSLVKREKLKGFYFEPSRT